MCKRTICVVQMPFRQTTSITENCNLDDCMQIKINLKLLKHICADI